MRKGIILAGGAGSRLYPTTEVISKQLLPIFDKPMIYYPLSVLMLSKIRDILVISTPKDTPRFESLLKDGSQWGLNITYAIQESPQGLAQAFIIGEKFIGNNPCCMILGDNLFYGDELSIKLQKISLSRKPATIFAYKVKNPERYGVVVFDKNKNPIKIVEKPKTPISRYAVTGLYFYEPSVVEIAKSLKPSPREELEITDINQIYLEMNQLDVVPFSRGIAWLDTGTFESLLDASQFIETIQSRQGFKIACPEEIAYKLGYIDKEAIVKLALHLQQNSYGEYLLDLIEDE